jgi:glycosyltransferase involved in cell wall biosynthesis
MEARAEIACAAQEFFAVKLAVLASHPIQYQAPLFRTIGQRLDLTVFFAHRATKSDQAKAGFGVEFQWDTNLLTGYAHQFLQNVARKPGLDRFSGCDTPEIGARLREGGFDVLLVEGWHFKSYLQAALSAKRQGMPVIVRGDSHLGTPRSRLRRAAKAFAYPAFLRIVFDAALFVGKRSREYWIHYHYPHSRLFFSPHCVDASWFGTHATAEARAALRHRLRITPDAKIALFAGKLVDFKRPLDLIAAAARMKQQGRDIGILVAGAGPLEAKLVASARESGVSVHLLGFCNQSEMPAAYAAADVLVLPSNGSETWGLVANEALACGRPVILSDAVGSAPDLAEDGIAGTVFRMGNIAALADAIARMVDHPPAVAAIATKSTEYSLEAAADGIVRAVASVTKLTGSYSKHVA